MNSIHSIKLLGELKRDYEKNPQTPNLLALRRKYEIVLTEGTAHVRLNGKIAPLRPR